MENQKSMRVEKKVFFVLLSLVLSLFMLTACASSTNDKQSSKEASTAAHVDINAMVLKGPSAIGAVKMMNDSYAAKDSSYSFQMVGAPDEVVSAISSGSVDIAVVPTNLAATLYNKTEGDIEMIAVTTLGSLYLVENGQVIQNMEDLRGKTIYSAGQGANPQFILEHLLASSGLTLGEDVFVEYMAEHSEVVARFAAGETEVVLLPEPFATLALSKLESAHTALDLNEVWKQENGDGFAMSCVIARTGFIEDHPEAVKAFMSDLSNSVKYTQDDLASTAELCVEHEIIASYDVALSAIPNCRIVYKEGSEMELLVSKYFEVLYAAKPASVGGAIPDEGLYYLG